VQRPAAEDLEDTIFWFGLPTETPQLILPIVCLMPLVGGHSRKIPSVEIEAPVAAANEALQLTAR
jgi:hypothetical protein